MFLFFRYLHGYTVMYYFAPRCILQKYKEQSSILPQTQLVYTIIELRVRVPFHLGSQKDIMVYLMEP